MKIVIFLAITSGLLFSNANAADPAVKFEANPNSLNVGTPFKVKCTVENVDPSNIISLTITYMFKSFDKTANPAQVPVSVGAWALIYLTNTSTFVTVDTSTITGVKLSKVGEGKFPEYETEVNPIDDKAKGEYHCLLKVIDASNVAGVDYASSVWSSSFAVVPSAIILVSCIVMALLRL